MYSPARQTRVYLLPVERADEAIRRYRLARLDAVALATPVIGDGVAQRSSAKPEEPRPERGAPQ